MSDVPADFNAPFLPIRRFAAAANSSPATVRRLLDSGRLDLGRKPLMGPITLGPIAHLFSAR